MSNSRGEKASKFDHLTDIEQQLADHAAARAQKAREQREADEAAREQRLLEYLAEREDRRLQQPPGLCIELTTEEITRKREI